MDNRDGEILAGFKDPDKKQTAFSWLLEDYQERLYWHIRKIVIAHSDADDVMQNTMIKVWKSIGQFRAESGLFTWLYRIATNEALSFLKQQKRRSIMPLGDDTTYLLQNLQSDDYFSGDEIDQKLQEAIIRLPEKQRLVFNMKYYDNLKYQQISEILETSEGALKASYHHAVKKIEEFMRLNS
ncbi:RNA polymerase sigma factor [Prolixibacteraceae bacterium JC049]|nr:RNA polymerase sigma factor [Prolixibacteraceae bacterium JC049]